MDDSSNIVIIPQHHPLRRTEPIPRDEFRGKILGGRFDWRELPRYIKPLERIGRYLVDTFGLKTGLSDVIGLGFLFLIACFIIMFVISVVEQAW